MRNVQTITLFLAVALISSSCSNPNDPEDQSTGVMYGTVRVFDENLKPLEDMSGVIARYVDSEGKVFEGVTNSEGVWEIDAPLGVYLQDTIMHPEYIQIYAGESFVAGTKQPIDWLGKGRRAVMEGTLFCPSVLKDVAQVEHDYSRLDSTLIPEDTTPYHEEPERHFLQLHSYMKVHMHAVTEDELNFELSLTLPDGTTVPVKIAHLKWVDSSTREFEIVSDKVETPWNSWMGARIHVKIRPIVVQRYWEPLGDGRWDYVKRDILCNPTETQFVAVP